MSSEFREELARTLKRKLARRDGKKKMWDLIHIQMLSDSERKTLNDADIRHLERWIEDADNPMWEVFLKHVVFIDMVLDQRRIAEAANDGDDTQNKESATQNKQLNELADAAEALAAFYRDPNSIMPFPSKWGSEWPLIPLNKLRAVLEREAVLLRASAPPIIEIDISRQGKTKKKRGSRSRGELTFMREVSAMVVDLRGENDNHVVAELTNIAFDLDDVTAADVREACRPRRRKAGHSTAK